MCFTLGAKSWAKEENGFLKKSAGALSDMKWTFYFLLNLKSALKSNKILLILDTATNTTTNTTTTATANTATNNDNGHFLERFHIYSGVMLLISLYKYINIFKGK